MGAGGVFIKKEGGGKAFITAAGSSISRFSLSPSSPLHFPCLHLQLMEQKKVNKEKGSCKGQAPRSGRF